MVWYGMVLNSRQLSLVYVICTCISWLIMIIFFIPWTLMSLTLMLESIVAQFNWHLYNIFNWDYQIELVIVLPLKKK